MMRKITILILTLMLSLALTACDGGTTPDSITPSENASTLDNDGQNNTPPSVNTTTPIIIEIQEERAREIAFEKLLDIQREIIEAGTFLSTEESSYVFLGDLIGDIEKYDNLPGFEMKLNSISDIDFISLGADVVENVWIIKAMVNTTWGDMDSILNCVWIFKIDRSTGEFLEKVWVGANYNID